jgi:hypothetical protein
VKEHEIPTFRNQKLFPRGIVPEDDERLHTLHTQEEDSQQYDASNGFDIGNPHTEEFETYDKYDTNNEVEKYWNDPNYDPANDTSQFNRPSSKYSTHNNSIR